MGNVVYHYCSVEAFFNIIKNSCFWMSDVGQSNDYEECRKIKEYVNGRMEEYLAKDEKALECWKKWYKIEEKDAPQVKRTFCVSFSEKEDWLSQWRGYAQDASGIAIGVDRDVLEQLNSVYDYIIAFGKVSYGIDDSAERIKKELIEKLQYKTIPNVLEDFLTNYGTKFPYIKNKCFEEEDEWRAVVCTCVSQYYCIPSSNEISFSKIKYRTTDGKLIPYIEMNFEKIKNNFIKEIIIGSKSKVSVGDVYDLLEYYGYYGQDEHNTKRPIGIRVSRATYR